MTENEPIYFLLVDDREENLVSLEALLSQDGVVLLKAKTGPEALELLLEYDVALALLDVQMPEMDGFELAELMRGNSKTGSIPIIFLTAGAADERRSFRGYQAGAVDFINKPIDPDVLKSKVAVFRNLKQQRNEYVRQRDEMRRIANENQRLLAESRRQSAQLKEADRRKDEFIATLAHELRNPLATIGCGLEVLRASPSSEDRETVREMMKRQLDHLTRLIEDLLDVSRISRGRIELRLEPVAISQVVTSAVETSQRLIDGGSHAFAMTMPEEEIMVRADATRLSQSISNLINNAAKYTPDGGAIALDVTAGESEVLIEVKDNGIGIAPEKQDQIFGLFEQVDPKSAHGQGGLGIGLSLSKSLVSLHCGEISMRSDGVGKGSVFAIKIPIDKESELPSTKPDSGTAQLNPGREKVLIVDDNRDAAKTLSLMLRSEGYTCASAHNGQRALELVSEIRPDILLLDIGLPDITGYEVCRKLRMDPANADILVIALTGWGARSDVEQAMEAGFDHHFVKPLMMEDFRNYMLERRSSVPSS